MEREMVFFKNIINSKKLSSIPEEHRYELLEEILVGNIKRDRILSYILFTIVFAILSLDIFVSNTNMLNRYISVKSYQIHIVLIIIPIIFLMRTYNISNISDENYFALKLMHIFLNTIVLVLCALIAVNNELVNQQPFAYVTAMFAVASMVILSPFERAIVYFSSYVVYIMGMIILIKDSQHIIQNIFFSIPLLILALIVSDINYSGFLRNFADTKTILVKNQELDNAYRITEETLKRRTEELNEAMELEKVRTAFFANISHELRTPLNVIFSAEQMLELTINKLNKAENKHEVTRYMKMIKQNSYRLIRLIANLIDITKMDAGYFQVNLRNWDIIKIIEDITISVAKYIEDKDINLTFDTELEEKIIACDPDKIERIMLNLLSNAVKFTPPEGNIYVNIYDKGGFIAVSVRDTGIGIPEEMRNLVFDRFYQVDKTTSRHREGSGIGLSIVKSLVEMHGGNIYLESEQDKGSEFIFEIPCKIISCEHKNNDADHINGNQNVEKINIEFSDIYS